jgi:hypothetical protein
MKRFETKTQRILLVTVTFLEQPYIWQGVITLGLALYLQFSACRSIT